MPRWRRPSSRRRSTPGHKALRAGTSGFLALPDAVKALTDREREVVTLAAHGKSNTEIADKLVVSPLTVRSHIHRAMTKPNARDRAQLVVIAYQSGLVKPHPHG